MDNDNPPAFDRSLLPPALIGIFSVIGICLVLLVYRYNTSSTVIEVTVTHTPFTYIFLGTEPSISTEPSPEETVTATLEEEPPLEFSPEPPVLLTPNTPQVIVIPTTSVPSTVIGPNATFTLTSASTPPLNPGTYDDIDFRLVYSGNWVNQTNVGGAYLNTLHISNTLTSPGNSVTFRFIGQEVRILYQSGGSLGVLRITLDTTTTQLNQSDPSNELVLTATQAGTHTVTLTHFSGGSVNLDSVIVPSISTATPTPTATP